MTTRIRLTGPHRTAPEPIPSVSRFSAIFLVVVVLAASAAPVAANDPPPATLEGEIVPGEVIVKWRDPIRGSQNSAARGLAMVEELGSNEDSPELASTQGRPVDAVLAELRADPAVEYAEPNYVVRLAVTSVDDPLTGDQYSLDQMRVRHAWDYTHGGSGVVAVLDTGVMASHPDLTGRVLPGKSFVGSSAADDNGHGTWVAGIIAANTDEGIGVAGISWSDKILPVKIMGRDGMGNTADLVAGIDWAVTNPIVANRATIINMSIGGFPFMQSVQDAVNRAWSAGVVLVGAAGNNHREERFFPASFSNVVSVSATQREDEFAHWSSYGPAVDVSAPGASVRTTNCRRPACAAGDTGDHTYISGTSFATPNVAGVVALIRAEYPTYTPAQVVNRLVTTVDDLGYPGWDNRYGAGRVNAEHAVGGPNSGPGPSSGDGLEPNNTLAQRRLIPLGATTRPNLHPAGDVDVFAVDVPRAGWLDVRVTGVVDNRAYPWNGSSLRIDPIVELYTTGGTLITSVDAAEENGTELARATLSGSTRVLVRVRNYWANGNATAYSVTPTFTPGFSDVAASPFGGDIMWLSTSGITAGCGGDRFCPRAVVTREQMASFLVRGLTLGPTSSDYFTDDADSAHQSDINRLAASGITGGCAAGRFCPRTSVTREQMASFLARALELPSATRDYFSDDSGSQHQANINRLAAAGITGGCSGTTFCPKSTVTREQMAAFLHRALDG